VHPHEPGFRGPSAAAWNRGSLREAPRGSASFERANRENKCLCRGPPRGSFRGVACNLQRTKVEELTMGVVSKAGTKAVKKTVKNEVGDVADKMVDKGPVDRMEDKLDDKKDEAIRKGIKKTVF
jgi:hypothetical protein